MKRDYSLFIKDILEAIRLIEEFTADMDFEQFAADEKTKAAVINKIEIIGEAAKNISKDIRDRYKDLPWKSMARMSDKISHSYFGINYEIVWEVVKKRLPEIKPMLEKIFNDMERE